MRYLQFFVIALFAFVPLASRADEVVIKASKVYTATGAALAPGAVRVKDGKIAEVAATIAVPGVKEIDLGNGVLLPGLIDAHTSIGIEGGASESTIEVSPNFRVLNAVDWSAHAFRQARSEGITSVCLVPGTDNVIAGISSIVKTAGERSKRVVKADHALIITMASDPANGNNSRNRPDTIYNRQPTNRMGVVWILRYEFGRAKAAPGESNAMLVEALAGKRPFVCVSRSDSDISAALRLREEYPMAMTLAGGHEAYKVKGELAAAKIPILLGMISSSAGNGPEGTETILNLAGTLHEAGIPVALSGGKLLEQARLAVRFGLPKDAAIAAVTAVPAKLLGLSDRIGTIAVGQDADLVALSGDPFELTSNIRWTMIDGVLRAEEP
jgi:imidazolonepropionase-like amidohydrolase